MVKRSEKEFLAILEKKAEEQKKLAESRIIPQWATRVGGWLAVHPWRVIVPASVIIYMLMRIVGGEWIREAVLFLYGGYRGA